MDLASHLDGFATTIPPKIVALRPEIAKVWHILSNLHYFFSIQFLELLSGERFAGGGARVRARLCHALGIERQSPPGARGA